MLRFIGLRKERLRKRAVDWLLVAVVVVDDGIQQINSRRAAEAGPKAFSADLLFRTKKAPRI